MEYYAYDKKGVVTAAAFGAYRFGEFLRCPVLIVKYGNENEEVTLIRADQKEKIRVRLPADAVASDGHIRLDFEELKVISDDVGLTLH